MRPVSAPAHLRISLPPWSRMTQKSAILGMFEDFNPFGAGDPVKRAGSDDSLRCSFCHKSQDVVGKLISSPSDYPRAYICDECIAVCNSILEDDRHEAPPVPEPHADQNSVWNHPLASAFLDMVEQWIVLETEGGDATPALAEMKLLAVRMKTPDSRLQRS